MQASRALLGTGHRQAEEREVFLSIPDAIDGIKALLSAIGGFYLLWHGF
jgi:hypothetical protein